ncbi:MAG: hypothetical protein ACOVN0_06340 [Niveispirillum sp.]|uniref:hypothetical protein n=1 Tax=Niveispirillum sp. TaxID=1917217 RepID=UPI003BA679F4
MVATLPMPNSTSRPLAEREWPQAHMKPDALQQAAARQSHKNAARAADLREKEWRAARPTDHLRRKAQVGQA